MNKKKEYKKPTMDAIALHYTQIIATSDGQGGGNNAPRYSGDPDDDE